MDDNKRELEKQLMLLKRLKKLSDEHLKKLKNVPDECIRTSSRGSFHQYYRIDPDSGNMIYLRRNNLNEIRPIIQKEYELKVSREINDLIGRFEKFIKNGNINSIMNIYENTCNAKKALISPIISSDEDYINNWLASHPGCQNPYPPKKPHETMNGEIVKSKSEQLIANTLFCRKIPYAYEPRLILDNNTVRYPDFVTLNVRTRKTVYWEHFGRLSDAGYCADNFPKLMLYEQNGIIVGDNLIITMESDEEVLDIHSVYRNIEKYLM